MTKWLVILAAALALAAAGCGSDGDDGAEDSAAGGEAVTVDLAEQNGSGETGTAMLEPAGEGMTRVVLSVEGAPTNPQPAHIHSGSCAELGDVVHGLENVTDGRGRPAPPGRRGARTSRARRRPAGSPPSTGRGRGPACGRAPARARGVRRAVGGSARPR
jgi:hypothetical protein